MTRERFELLAAPGGALVVGDPDEVADKIAAADRALGGVDRFSLQMAVGPVPRHERIWSIELLGEEVVRRAADRLAAAG